MRKPVFFRVLFYVIGLIVLALGLPLNTKTGLGVSPIISVAYSISEIFDQETDPADGCSPDPAEPGIYPLPERIFSGDPGVLF